MSKRLHPLDSVDSGRSREAGRLLGIAFVRLLAHGANLHSNSRNGLDESAPPEPSCAAVKPHDRDQELA